VDGMIYRLYEWHLKRGLKSLPEHLCIMIDEQDMTESPGKLREVSSWCSEMGIPQVTFHISTRNPDRLAPYLDWIRSTAEVARLTLYTGDGVERTGTGIDVTVAIGMSGRQEIAECIRKMAKNGVDPESVNEETFTGYLTFKWEPDLMIKTGGSHLTDFFIWQSVYSEISFTDINWNLFRKTDFLRALRDFQLRKRRYGR
jgi:undecaprenyl diphosphate synthase